MPFAKNNLERNYQANGKNAFIMQLFNVPPGITRKDLSLDHEHIENWELMGTDTQKGVNVANITFHTDRNFDVAELEGNISVSSNLYDIQGVDIEIAAW